MKELRLLKCKLAVELLDYLARTNITLDATKVELTLRHSEIDGMESDMIDLLAPFKGLEDLFLLFDSDYADGYYAEMILRHGDTLRRLVYHRRHYCMAEKAPYWEEYCDSSLDDAEGGGFADILRETKLESAGVCGEPLKLQKSFQSIASRVNSLKLLHLRFTGKAERKPKFFKEDEAYGDSPSSEVGRAYFEAQRNGTTPPRRSPGPSEADSESGGNKSKGRTGAKMKKRSWKLSRIGLLVPMDFHVSRLLPLVIFPMGTVSPTLIRSGAGKPAVPGAKRHGARSNGATLRKTS